MAGMTTRNLAQYWKKTIKETQDLMRLFGVWVQDIDTPLNRAQIVLINAGVEVWNRGKNKTPSFADATSSPREEESADEPTASTEEDGDDEEDNSENQPFGKPFDNESGSSKESDSENGISSEIVGDEDDEASDPPETADVGTKEASAQQKLEEYVQKYYIFFDTSSLIEPRCLDLLERLEPFLIKKNRKIYIPSRVLEELQELSQDDPQFETEYNKIMDILMRFYQNGILSKRGDNSDGTVDNVFLTQFTRLRLQYPLLLVTQNKTLKADILSLNRSKSVKGYKIQVQKISKYGYFADFELPSPMYHIGTTVTTASTDSMLSSVPECGEEVYTSNGRMIKLEERISFGGEGVLYSTDIDLVAKIYHAAQVTELRKQKLELMVRNRIKHDYICWPEEVLYDAQGRFVGYMMKKAEGIPLRDILSPLYISEEFPEWQKKDLVSVAKSIIDKIVFLHKNNILLGDINLNNFMVEDSNTVYFVDTDSYQINEFPCPVGVPDYTPPELQGKNFSTCMRTMENENFAVAVLMFMILMLGKRPYDKINGEGICNDIKEADFAYPLGDDNTDVVPIGGWRYLWSHLPYKVKEAFYMVFRKDKNHYAPEKRYTSRQWKWFMKYYGEYLGKIEYQVQHPEVEKKFDSRSLEISPQCFKFSAACKICGKQRYEQDLMQGICRKCLNEGSTCQCESCGKDMIYTNHRKYIKKKPAPKYCKECNTVGTQKICLECGNPFDVTVAQMEDEKRGKRNINYCPQCRKMSSNIYERRQCSGENCRKFFTITYGEKWYLEEKGFQLPTKCPDCRGKNK